MGRRKRGKISKFMDGEVDEAVEAKGLDKGKTAVPKDGANV